MSYGYQTTLGDLLGANSSQMIGELIRASSVQGFSQHWNSQTSAWEKEIEILQAVAATLVESELAAASWTVLLEYEIARRDRRIDAIILADHVVLVLEFKIGATTFDAGSVWQAKEYALDLRDFHAASAHATIVPILIATGVQWLSPTTSAPELVRGGVCEVVKCGRLDLASAVFACETLAHQIGAESVARHTWADAPYRPSLSIIDAARSVFDGH
jgi:hypothetical protein